MLLQNMVACRASALQACLTDSACTPSHPFPCATNLHALNPSAIARVVAQQPTGKWLTHLCHILAVGALSIVPSTPTGAYAGYHRELATLAEELEGATTLLHRRAMACRALLPTSEPDNKLATLTGDDANITPPPNMSQKESLDDVMLIRDVSNISMHSVERMLSITSENGELLDSLLTEASQSSANVMQWIPSCLDELLLDRPLAPQGCDPGDLGDDLVQALLSGTNTAVSPGSPAVDSPKTCPTGNFESLSDAKQSFPASGVSDQPTDEAIDYWNERSGGSLRALLASLHEVVPPGSSIGWERTGLSGLVTDQHVKRAYSRALLATHPDRLPSPSQSAGQKVFNILCQAWTAHNEAKHSAG